MAIVKGRHIRHDWRTFNDRQDQKSVRTLCNRTSTPKVSGIPTVTDQKAWIVDNASGDIMWGWCWSCSRVFFREFSEDNIENAPGTIKDQYDYLFQWGQSFREASRMMVERGESIYATPIIRAPQVKI